MGATSADERDRIDFIYHNDVDLLVKNACLVGPLEYFVFGKAETASASTSQGPFLEAVQKMPWPSDHKGLLVDFELQPESQHEQVLCKPTSAPLASTAAHKSYADDKARWVPFGHVGSRIELSNDGCTATRVDGVTHGVCLGKEPLPQHSEGRYY